MNKISRNQPCPCKSGRKYKDCCLFTRHGGERIRVKLQTKTDLSKEIIRKMIEKHHVERMSEIIREKTNAGEKRSISEKSVHKSNT